MLMSSGTADSGTRATPPGGTTVVAWSGGVTVVTCDTDTGGAPPCGSAPGTPCDSAGGLLDCGVSAVVIVDVPCGVSPDDWN